MADEITGQLSLTVRNGNFTDQIYETFSYDQNNIGGGRPGTVTAALNPSSTITTISDITLPGFVFLKNLDNTNTIIYGPGSGNYIGKLKPGEIAFFRLNVSGNQIQSQTTSGAAAKLLILCFEN